MAGPWNDFFGDKRSDKSLSDLVVERPQDGSPWNDFRKGPEKSADYEKGRTLGSGTQGFFNALQGLTLGFGDEVAGVGGALAGAVGNAIGRDDGTTFAERYRRTRDAVRGAQDQFSEDRPVFATATKLAAGAPFAAIGGAPAVGAVPLGIGATTVQAAKIAGALGAAQGLGESTADGVGAMLADAAKGGASSAALGGAGNLAVSGLGAVAGGVRRAISKPAAQDFARLKVAEAIIRDAREGGIPAVAIDDAANAMNSLGRETRVADVAGESTRALLDTMATLPGRTKNLAEAAIRERQAGRAGRIIGAADDALGTGGRGFVDELDALAQAKARESAPLYAQVRDVPVPLDKDVKGLLARVPRNAWRDTAMIVKAETGQDLNIGELLKSESVPLSLLDSLKRGLYASGQGLKVAGKRDVARPIDDVRTALISKLDEISPKDAAGKSIYQSARETYGGFANLEELVNAGRKAMTDDTLNVRELTKGLDEAQRQAFRIGALQALKQKVGTQSGQTSLLKFQVEPATQERLRAIFGDDVQMGKFVKALENESTLKRLEGVGRGSQTAARLAGMADAEVSPLAGQVARGNFREAAANALANIVGRVRTPEATRDEIGRILLSREGIGQEELNKLRQYVDKVNKARTSRASAVGAFAGIAP